MTAVTPREKAFVCPKGKLRMDKEQSISQNTALLRAGDLWRPRTKDNTGKFERRIRLLFLGAFIALGIYAVAATAIFISLAREQTDFIEHHLDKLLSIKDLEIEFEGCVAATRTYVLTQDPAALEQATKNHERAFTLLDELKNLSTSPAETTLINSARDSLTKYVQTVKTEMGEHLTGKLTLLDADHFEKGIAPQRYVVREDLEQFRQYTDRQYSQAMSDAQKIWRFSFVLYGAVALFSFAFFGALRWVLLRALAQKRSAEEALHLSEEIARQAVDLTEIGIFNHNHIDSSVQCSPQLFSILGIDEKDAVTIAKYLELIPDSERDAVVATMDKALDPKGSGTFQAEHRLIRKDGTVRWVTVRGQTYFEKHMGRLRSIRSIGAILDITKRKEIEISLRQAMEDLAQEKIKLERSNYELDQFASVAAHDLRAPITSMLGWIGIIDKLIPKPREDKIVKAINFITINAKKADALISDLLALARLNTEAIKIQPVDLDKLLKNVLAVLKEPIESTKATVTFEKLPTVKGCLSHFDSLFTNLIRNALTYRHNTRAPKIEISCQTHFDFYEFSIKDNGIGIDAHYKDRIFEMFKRLNPENEFAGTGIGLSYCKKVVELHGGQIWVDSTPDQGSTFYFTYPITDPLSKELV